MVSPHRLNAEGQQGRATPHLRPDAGTERQDARLQGPRRIARQRHPQRPAQRLAPRPRAPRPRWSRPPRRRSWSRCGAAPRPSALPLQPLHRVDDHAPGVRGEQVVADGVERDVDAHGPRRSAHCRSCQTRPCGFRQALPGAVEVRDPPDQQIDRPGRARIAEQRPPARASRGRTPPRHPPATARGMAAPRGSRRTRRRPRRRGRRTRAGRAPDRGTSAAERVEESPDRAAVSRSQRLGRRRDHPGAGAPHEPPVGAPSGPRDRRPATASARASRTRAPIAPSRSDVGDVSVPPRRPPMPHAT